MEDIYMNIPNCLYFPETGNSSPSNDAEGKISCGTLYKLLTNRRKDCARLLDLLLLKD